MAPKLELLADAVLFRLYEFSQEGDGYIEQSSVPMLLNGKISGKQAALALDVLEERNHCYVGHGSYETTASINKAGYIEVERQLEEPDSFMSFYSQRGDEWLFESGGVIENQIPAADRYVSSQDNQSSVSDIRQKVEALTTAVQADRSNDFDDKEGRLAELAALDLLLGQTLISVPLVEKILNETVRYLAEKFVDNAVGIAANAVLLAAAALFGIVG